MGQNTRLAELRSAIDRTAQLYHTPGCISPIDDAEYDALMNELRSIDPSDERLTRVGTPYSSSGMRQEVDHKMPMGSLDNTIGSIAGFEPWYANVCSLAGAHSLDVNASLKMDGLSVELIYEVGKFKQAVTRGNGSVGLDITANAVRWIGVPTVLSAPFSGSIRGECMLYHSEFEQIKQANPGEDYSNERNLCSGIAGRTDGKDNEKQAAPLQQRSISDLASSMEGTAERAIEQGEALGMIPQSQQTVMFNPDDYTDSSAA